MSLKSPGGEPGPAAAERAARLCMVIENDYDRLRQAIIVLVMKDGLPLHPHTLEERVQELLGETVSESLAHAANYDPSRSGLAWMLGIAARLLLARRRSAARERRQVPGSVLGDAAWEQCLGQLCHTPVDDPVASRLDVQQALARLDDMNRHILELRYFHGLDGEDLARALGAPTAGAARVRVCRALQTLRAQFLTS